MLCSSSSFTPWSYNTGAHIRHLKQSVFIHCQSPSIFTFIMSCLTNNNRNARRESISFWFGLGPSGNITRKKTKCTLIKLTCSLSFCDVGNPYPGLWPGLHCGPEGWQPSSSIWACAWPAGLCSPSELCCRWSLCLWTLLLGTCTAPAAPVHKNAPYVCVTNGCWWKAG